MILAKFRVQPTEVRKFYLDYSQRLPTGDNQIVDVSVRVTPVFEGEGRFAVAAFIGASGTDLTLLTFGGEDGIDYKADIQVSVDPLAVVWEDEVIFIVEDV